MQSDHERRESVSRGQLDPFDVPRARCGRFNLQAERLPKATASMDEPPVERNVAGRLRLLVPHNAQYPSF